MTLPLVTRLPISFSSIMVTYLGRSQDQAVQNEVEAEFAKLLTAFSRN